MSIFIKTPYLCLDIVGIIALSHLDIGINFEIADRRQIQNKMGILR